LTTPIVQGGSTDNWLRDAAEFCDEPFYPKAHWDPFFTEVAHPMAMVSLARKKGDTGYMWGDRIQTGDWKRATLEWIDRREAAKRKG
jgi:hypothetical protein